MPTRDDPAHRGRRRGDDLTRRLGLELRDARVGHGLSQDKVARAAGVPRATISRIENGRAPNVPIRLAAALAALVGLDLAVSTYPGGRPIRDVAQVRLMARLTERIGGDWRWSFEVPLPVPGDQRAWDAVVTRRASRERFGLEAVTRIHDLQALLRRISLKARDGGLERVVLLVADTRTNRRSVEEGTIVLGKAFPSGTRAALMALSRGELPPGDALIVL
jgi:transcriptional regulator with XRE-family HTH domain